MIKQLQGTAEKWSVLFLQSTNPTRRDTNNELILLKSLAYVAEALYILFLCATDLHCCPKLFKTYE